MADKMKIGAGLALDGEAEFKKAISGINKDLSVLGSEMKKVTAQFDGNANSMEALTAKQDVYNKRADEQRKKVEAMSAALENAKKEFGENSDKVKDWQIKLNNAEAELSKTNSQIDENAKYLKEAKKSADGHAKSIDEAGKKAKGSGEDAEKGGGGWEKLGSVLGGVAKAAGVAVAALATAAAGAAVGLGKKVVESYGELEQNLGGSEAVFGEYAKNIQATGEDAYKNLGVSQSEYLATANKVGALFQGAGLDQKKSLDLTERAMQRATDAASVMGIDTSAALEAITGAAKGNYTMMDNLGVAMSETSLKAYALSKGLDYGDISKDQAKKAELAMEYFFEKTSQYEGNFAKEATESISGSFGLLSASWETLLAGFGNKDADMSKLTNNLTDAIGAVVKNITPVINNMVAALPQVFNAIIPAITGLLPQVLSAATSLFNSLLSAIIGLLPTLIPVAVDALLMITNTLVDNLPLIIEAAMTLIVTLAKGIAEALPELMPTIVDTMLLIVDTLIENIDLLVDATIAIMTALAEGLINALPILIEKTPEIIVKIVEALANNMPKIVEMGIQLVAALAGALISAMPQLLAKIPEMIAGIVNAFASYYTEIYNIGKNIVEGIWNGISGAYEWIYGKIKGWVTNVLDYIKGLLGIHSPSTVFAGIGKNMALGLGNGFESEMNSVAKRINNSIPTNVNVTGAYQTEGLVNGLAAVMNSAPTAMGGAYTINLVVSDKTLASVVFDPIRQIAKQRGVSFA